MHDWQEHAMTLVRQINQNVYQETIIAQAVGALVYAWHIASM